MELLGLHLPSWGESVEKKANRGKANQAMGEGERPEHYIYIRE
jgi:hypothetical protein